MSDAGGAWRLADLLLRRAVIDATVVANQLGIETGQGPARTRGHRFRALTGLEDLAGEVQPGPRLAPLVDAGVLTEFTGVERNRLWQAREVLFGNDGTCAVEIFELKAM